MSARPIREEPVDPHPPDQPTQSQPTPGSQRPDPRLRPADPAGTQPKVDPASLLPARREPEVLSPTALLDSPRDPDLLPEPVPAAPLAAMEVPHAERFQFLLGALIALGVAALAAAVVLFFGRAPTREGPTWAAWHPSASGMAAAQQIADHVGPEYRLPGGQQLVALTGGAPEVAGLPMTVALRSDPNNANAVTLIGGQSVLYRMCGLGPRCAIDQGKPSTQRAFLLRREALELALYTFHYIGGIDQVVVFLTPRPGQAPSSALFLRRSDLQLELSQPLPTTLARGTPGVSDVERWPDASLVAHVTAPTLYSFSLTQSNQDASVFLVLRPPGLATTSPTGTVTGQP